jgi:predicted TIM-barrel fold metal-dependent hydrolase
MSTYPDWNIIDFHAHIRPPWWKPEALAGFRNISDEEKGGLLKNLAKLSDIDALLRENEESAVNLRLLSATIEGFFGTEGATDIGRIRQINDFLAEIQRRHSGRLAALAAIDAFSGDEGAREVERAVKQLGHVGIVIDSSREQHLLGHPSVRPTLEAAAQFKVPVLVHPVGAPNSDMLAQEGGLTAYSLGRGFVNGAAFLSVLRSGLLEKLPDLHLVFTALGVGSLVVAAAESEHFSEEGRARKLKLNVYFDIMGLNPQTIRYLVDFLGADRVLVGSDWPIWAAVSRESLRHAFTAASLTEEEQKLVAGENAFRLLNLGRV